MQRITDLTISVLASAVSFLLSWPFWRDFEYFAESHIAWWIYFIAGFLLAVYVFYIFIGSLRILFVHDAVPSAATDDPYTPALPGNDKGTIS
ncbi:MAG: hypothetical protein ABI304_00025 [Rudaea sp.]